MHWKGKASCVKKRKKRYLSSGIRFPYCLMICSSFTSNASARVHALLSALCDLLQRIPADRVVGSECVTLARALLTLVLALLIVPYDFLQRIPADR
jgi:hypothetical protein